MDGSTKSCSEPSARITRSSFKASLQRFNYSDINASSAASYTEPHRPTPLSVSKRKRAALDDSSSAKSPKRRSPSSASSSKYAPPSTYAHLAPLPDILAPELIAIFVGFNPGIRTASTGHAYAHPSNLFWKLLHASGLTPPDRRWRPSEDGKLPTIGLGNTNLVSRPSRDVAELSKTEMSAGTPVLEAKVREYRPEAVCIVGKAIWEAVWRWRKGRGMRKEEFRYGWQGDGENLGKTEGWEGARVFVATSTSGLSAGMSWAEKVEVWKGFGEWVGKRRSERGKFGGEGEVEGRG
jgi:thymine-DNA glycosylase